jgi:hypothetical protein
VATNFSVTDASVQDYVTDGGVNISRYRRMRSAVLDAVRLSGGKYYGQLAPVTTSVPVFSGQAAVSATAESQVSTLRTKQTSGRAVTSMNLLVAAHGELERTTDQALRASLHGLTTAGSFMTQMTAAKLPAIYSGFDETHLGTTITASATDVEWVAASGVNTISTALATYDETAYNADAMIVTRKGRRLMGLSVDADGNIVGGSGLFDSIRNVFDGPILYTDATAADIGTPNLLAVMGPFSTCAVGESGGNIVKVFDQLEDTGGGAHQNVISFLVERYLGFVRPPVAVVPNSAWVTITDDA